MKKISFLFLLLVNLINANAQCWKSVSGGAQFTIGIKTDGTMWAWGTNHEGELGDSSYVNKNMPSQIGSDNDWQSVSAGSGHTVAIKNDGTLWTWGANELGVLADSSF